MSFRFTNLAWSQEDSDVHYCEQSFASRRQSLHLSAMTLDSRLKLESIGGRDES